MGTHESRTAGRGSYGSVYKALLKATGEFVAIKVIQLGEGDKIADIQKEISMLSECNHPNVVRYIVSLSNLGCAKSPLTRLSAAVSSPTFCSFNAVMPLSRLHLLDVRLNGSWRRPRKDKHSQGCFLQGSWRDRDKLWIVMEYCGGGSVSDLIQANSNQPLDEEIIAYICRETLAGLAYLHSIGKVHNDSCCTTILQNMLHVFVKSYLFLPLRALRRKRLAPF